MNKKLFLIFKVIVILLVMAVLFVAINFSFAYETNNPLFSLFLFLGFQTIMFAIHTHYLKADKKGEKIGNIGVFIVFSIGVINVIFLFRELRDIFLYPDMLRYVVWGPYWIKILVYIVQIVIVLLFLKIIAEKKSVEVESNKEENKGPLEE